MEVQTDSKLDLLINVGILTPLFEAIQKHASLAFTESFLGFSSLTNTYWADQSAVGERSLSYTPKQRSVAAIEEKPPDDTCTMF